tara:strand:+ start:607 stop:2274 length:1668 start_codon:yes stop_codon:yes gene_type:complete
MADQIQQAGYHSFTTDELIAGTRNDIVTTNSTTNLVIKSIEATQGQPTDAITAEATIGLTSGLASGQFTSLGNCAQANRLGLEGSVIMPPSSTLSIRPTAKNIVFTDEKVFNSNNNSSNFTTIQDQVVNVSVSGQSEPTLNTQTQVDKSSVTFGSNLGYTLYNYPNNYTIFHTNANGLNLRILFYNYSSNQTGFDIWNADTGTFLGGYYDLYQRGHFDGSRYIFFMYQGGPSDTRIRWIDLDETETNLTAANTTGGGNSGSYWHGQTAIAADSPSHQSPTSYDNHLQGFYHNRHTNGKKYLFGYSMNNSRAWLYEVPETLVNDNSTTVAPRWQYLSSTSSHQNGTDPFGNNSGSAVNMVNAFVNYYSNQQYQDLRLTFDTGLARYLIYYNRGNRKRMVFTFTQAEMEEGFATHGPIIGTHGLHAVAVASASLINVASSVFNNVGSNNGEIDWGDILANSAFASYNAHSYNTFFVDGSENHYFKNSGTPDYYQVHRFNPNDLNAGPTKLTTETAAGGFDSDFAVFNVAPTNAQRSARTYTKAPSLRCRVTAILSDQ